MEKVLNYDDIEAKATRLLEGGVVEIDGRLFRAYEYLGDRYPCDDCELNGACGHPICDVCAECDYIDGRFFCLSDDKKFEAL